MDLKVSLLRITRFSTLRLYKKNFYIKNFLHSFHKITLIIMRLRLKLSLRTLAHENVVTQFS